MNYSNLLKTQAELDKKIVEGKGLQGQDLLYKKVEALLCEIQETANEERSWKYWSNKQADVTEVLKETVDVLHFILSIGNDLNITAEEIENTPARLYEDATSQFLALSYVAVNIAMFNDKRLYYFETIKAFKGLVALLGFTNEELEAAYYEKNKVNHERQASNY